MKNIAIVAPVLDDWDSFEALIGEISNLFAGSGLSIRIVAVDDGSTSRFDFRGLQGLENGCLASVEVIRLVLNLGHQRAIAVGLCELAKRSDIDAVVVMDSDGEDQPKDISLLLSAAHSHPAHTILALRAERSESRKFRLGYRIYKSLFYLATGRAINFGNFSLLPMPCVERLVHMPELWNNLAATIMRSRIPLYRVPTARGRRYRGRSKMNFVSLTAHGLSAISVYTDIVFVRVLIAGGIVAVATVLGMAFTIAIKLATDLAIPGWTTTVVVSLLSILMQALILVVATTLMVLGGRSAKPMIPILDCGSFIAEQTVHEFAAAPARAASSESVS
jgi:hypothetical protein